jgi:hypothetical protein
MDKEDFKATILDKSAASKVWGQMNTMTQFKNEKMQEEFIKQLRADFT